MPVTVVVGGQFGSEGKGKLVAHLSIKDHAGMVIRCGGPNAGHTVEWMNKRYVLRQVPCGWVNPETRLLLAAGAVIDPAILCKEVEALEVGGRIGVDRNAVVLLPAHIEQERHLAMSDRIASTLSGTGAATSAKVLRGADVITAGDLPELTDWCTDVSREANAALESGTIVIIEGSQGFGLSLHHSPHYPYVTSRDTSAAGALSEAGLSPRTVTDIVMAIRTFPIRVAGNSGPLTNEISWDAVRRLSGAPGKISEYTSVTKQLRLVGRFDIEFIEQAVRLNRPTHLAIHGLDYLSYSDFRKTSYDKLSGISRSFVESLEDKLGVPASFLSTGPAQEHIIDRR